MSAGAGAGRGREETAPAERLAASQRERGLWSCAESGQEALNGLEKAATVTS